MTETDRLNLERWRNKRDAEAFDALVSTYAGMVYATCSRILKNAADAEDVTQECFITLAQDCRARKSLGGWLHRVAVNRSLDRIRSDSRRRKREVAYSEAGADARPRAWRDVEGFIDEAIANLPEHQRTPIVAHFLERKSHIEIADELGIARRTVAHRIQRGVEALRNALERRGVKIGAVALAAALTQNTVQAAPIALLASLGKVAAAGSTNVLASSPAVMTATGGVLVMKKTLVVSTIALVSLLGFLYTSLILNPREEPPFPIAPDTQIIPDPPPPLLDGPVAESSASRDAVAEATIEPVAIVETGSIAGRAYVAATGDGLPGVTIVVNPTENPLNETARVTTNEHGQFSVPDLLPGQYTVQREKIAGYQSPFSREEGSISVTVNAGQGVKDVDFVLEEGYRASGRVVGPDNTPIADAKVFIHRYSGDSDVATTNADGAFTFSGLILAKDIQFSARKDNLISSLTDLMDIDGNLHDILIRVGPEAVIEGYVVDERNSPMKGVEVQAAIITDTSWSPYGSGMTDREGRFTIGRLAPGTYEMAVTKDRYASFGRSLKQVTLSEGQHLPGVRIVYTKGQSLSGRVTDVGGKGIARATINVWGLGSGLRLSKYAHTDWGGDYEVGDLPDGHYGVSVRRDDYVRMSRLYVTAGAADVDFVLRELDTLKGRVIRADTGEPVTRFTVAYSHRELNEIRGDMFLERKQVNDPNGRFSLSNIQSGSGSILVSAPGYASKLTPVSGASPHDLTVSLVPANDRMGIVLDRSSQPIAGALIFVGPLPHHTYHNRLAACTTTPDGTFSLDSLPDERQLVTAYHPKYAPSSTAVSGRDANAFIRLTLYAGGSVEGYVTEQGKPLPGTSVALQYDEGHVADDLSATTDTSGFFRIDGIAPGEAEISCAVDRDHLGTPLLLKKRITVNDGLVTRSNMRIERGTAQLSGTVYNTGEPFQWAQIAVTMYPGNQTVTGSRYVPNHEEFMLTRLPEGRATVTLSVRTGAGKLIEEEFEIELDADRPSRQDFHLRH